MKRKKFKPATGGAGKRRRPVAEMLQLAIKKHQQGRVDQAQKIYRKILKENPGHVDATHFLGLLRYQRGDVEQGLLLIRKAIRRRPDYADAYNNLGVILKEQGETQEAATAFKTCLELTPDNPGALSNLGMLLREQGNIEEAIDCYHRSIALNPAHTPAYQNLANVLVNRDPDQAAEVIRQWLVHDPDNSEARHMLASCTHEDIPSRASDDYVEDHFDRFADRFDESLARLGYQAPQLVATAVANAVGEPGRSLKILDAGCGTGLCGPLLRPYAAQLVGVDLSRGMVEKARVRDVYDKLVVEELTAFLGARDETYDLIASADTLIYFGDLQPVFSAAHSALKPGGHLVFTLEELRDDLEHDGYRLNTNGRYSHAKGSARETLERSGLLCRSIEPGILRTENDEPVLGLIFTAVRRPGMH